MSASVQLVSPRTGQASQLLLIRGPGKHSIPSRMFLPQRPSPRSHIRVFGTTASWCSGQNVSVPKKTGTLPQDDVSGNVTATCSEVLGQDTGTRVSAGRPRHLNKTCIGGSVYTLSTPAPGPAQASRQDFANQLQSTVCLHRACLHRACLHRGRQQTAQSRAFRGRGAYMAAAGSEGRDRQNAACLNA